MSRRNFFKKLGLASAGLLVPAETLLASENKETYLKTDVDTVSGAVTTNGNGIANVLVSDGFTVVATNKKGKYSLQLHPYAKFVFISVPSGYVIPTDNGIAKFYIALAELADTKNANFSLEASSSNEDDYSFIVWADPQIRNRQDADKFLSISVPDTATHVNQMINKPLFGIGCGDLIWDKQELFADYKQGVKNVGIPFWQAIGNHDMEYKSRTDEGSAEAFNNQFGPTYYSFNRGSVHYVVLDDVFFIGNDRKYIGYLTETQLTWLESDLKHVPKGSTLVIALHIPTKTGIVAREHMKEEPLGGSLMNREALYTIVKEYNVNFISGHTHFNEVWETENMREHVMGTLCGAWWTGPFCGDGTPAGYAVFNVKGNDLSWYYKSTGFPKDYQIRVMGKGADSTMPEHIFANVWNYDEQWKVEWFEDEVLMGEMQQHTGYDPEAYKAYYGDKMPEKRKWVEPIATSHLFIAKPSNAAKTIKVKATDRFGNVYYATTSV